MKKMTISEKVDWISKYSFTGEIDDIIKLLTIAKKEQKDAGYDELKLDWTTDGDDSGFDLIGYRLETDAEFKYRCDREEKKKEKQALLDIENQKAKEQIERETLVILLKKYGLPLFK